MSTDDKVRGSCLCRAVVWEAAKPFSLMSHCHCSMCRKSHGAPFATYVSAPAASFRWLQGQDSIARYRSSDRNVRTFCKHCGSIVPETVSGELAWMPAGNLDSDPEARPRAHIFVASKAPWYPLPEDGLPRYDAYPPGYGEAVSVRPTEAASDAGWVRGACLCNDVAYEIESGGWTLMQCHCSRCRKGRSAAHGGNLFAKPERFRWIRGETSVQAYKPPDAARFAVAFCPRCGSSMPRCAPTHTVVPAASLDGDPGITARRHIFVDSKAPWFTIADDFPQDPEFPPPAS